MKNILISGAILLMVACGSSKKVVSAKKSKPVNVETHKEVKVAPTKHVTKEVAKVIEKTKKATKSHLNTTTLAYVEKYAPLAMDEMRKFNIPASITLAQGILESGSGKSQLSAKSNNHFGIKCHSGWKGAKVYHDDDAKGECFRKYKYPATSYQDHSLFLSTRFRYASLFKLKKDDYKGWAKGLKKAGYATDPKYPNKLISFIEKYELYRYDDLVLKRKVVANDFKYAVSEQAIRSLNTSARVKTKVVEKVASDEIKQVSSTIAKQSKKRDTIKKIDSEGIHIVSGEDTLYSISRKYGVSVAEIKTMNGLVENIIHEGDELKLRKTTKRVNYHVVKKKETLYSISRKYNLTVSYLKKINHLHNNNLSIGQELNVK